MGNDRDVPAPLEKPAPAIVRALAGHGLRVVFFAAAGDAPAPAYDGVIVERATSPAPKAGKPARPR